jgi:putative DNA primase/helicase
MTTIPEPSELSHRPARFDPRQGQVIIVGSVAARDRLAAMTGRHVVAWADGSGTADWSPLAGRDVVIWPDADEPGVRTAGEIAIILAGLGCRVRIMDIRDRPDGWDCADATDELGWSKADLDGFMRATAKPWSPQPVEKSSADNPAAPAAQFTNPKIRVVKGLAYRAVDEAIAVLANREIGIYARADELVRPVVYATPPAR